MAQRRTPIQVPPRGEDEAPATAEQLQTIREMVTGMSLSGFRFDYRKMGTDQAGSVIEQLMQLRDMSGVPAKQAGGGGCVGAVMRAFARGVTTLVVAVIVLAGVAAGGYLIYKKINETPPGGQQVASQDGEGDNDTKASDNNRDDGNLRDSKIFDGLKVRDDNPADNDEPRRITPGPITTDPGPTTDPNPVTPTPNPLDRKVAEQLDALEQMLVQLSQFTRKDYDASIRSRSAAGMQKRLGDLSLAMDTVRKADASLADRINAVVEAYAAPQIDGEAMRGQIEAIRGALAELRGRL